MVPSTGDTLLLLSVVGAFLAAVTRRVPLAAALALPAAVFLATHVTSARDLPEKSLLLAGLVLLAIPIVILTVWVELRCFYWIPDRLTIPDESRGVGCLDQLKNIAELCALGFRPVGALCLRSGFERQIRHYFADPTGFLSACVIRSRWGTRGISFCTEQDGARLVTSDWPFVPVFPLPYGWVKYVHHQGRSAQELLREHRIHLAELAMDAPDRCDDLLERERMRFEEEVEEVIGRGRLVRDRRGRLRVTLRAMPGILCRVLFFDFRRKCWRFGR